MSTYSDIIRQTDITLTHDIANELDFFWIQGNNQHKIVRLLHILHYHSMSKAENMISHYNLLHFFSKMENIKYKYLVIGREDTFFVHEHSDADKT